ncbi:MAG: hypothetical protein KBS62_01345 [Oscillospiraceae bacterium]|nr:hypothetical protein [Candidatus Ruminococcus equi]
MKIISTSGYGASGSSAVYDFVRQFNEVNCFSGSEEFQFIRMPDGIMDLKHFLTDGSGMIACNNAIIRFEKAMKKGFFAENCRGVLGKKYDDIIDNYLSKIIQVKWKGKSIFDPSDITIRKENVFFRKIDNKIESALRKTVNKEAHFPAIKERYFSMMSENEFNKITKEFVEEFIYAFPGIKSEKPLLIDQIFPATDSQKGTEFFDETKVIIVNRDPRCMYVGAHRSITENAFMPCDNVENFVKYYRALCENEVRSDKALYVNYDELIFDYYNTTQKIIDYLGFDKRPENEFKHFNPNVSVTYTLPMLTCYDKKDVEYIEKELGDYLYDFPEYKKIEKADELYEEHGIQ